MSTTDFGPDPHLDPAVAAAYDDPDHERWSPAVLAQTVAVLRGLADGGSAVEFAVGTGRVALPLAESGVQVYGIDFSAAMLAELEKKDREGLVAVTAGDMTETRVCDLVDQISISHHYTIDGDRMRVSKPAFRYVWPGELDLMAQLAGMYLESRWAGWDQAPFIDRARSHVSVWRKPTMHESRR